MYTTKNSKRNPFIALPPILARTLGIATLHGGYALERSFCLTLEILAVEIFLDIPVPLLLSKAPSLPICSKWRYSDFWLRPRYESRWFEVFDFC